MTDICKKTENRPFSKHIGAFFSLFLILSFSFLSNSCISISSLFSKPAYKISLSRKIMDPGFFTSVELADFFMSQNPDADRTEVDELAFYYVYEGLSEGINYSVAFAQMCLETGYLKFGNLVTKDMHNYCGLGSTDKDNPGASFATMQLGVRAHIQHLQAYATKEDQPLNNPVVDPRYDWSHKTKYITDITGLAGNWATDPKYSEKIESILCKMEDFYNN